MADPEASDVPSDGPGTLPDSGPISDEAIDSVAEVSGSEAESDRGAEQHPESTTPAPSAEQLSERAPASAPELETKTETEVAALPEPGSEQEPQLTAGETVALVATTDVALPAAKQSDFAPVKLGSPVSQPSPFLSVRPLQTPAVPVQAVRRGAGTAGSSRLRVRVPSTQDLCFAAHRGDMASIEALLSHRTLDRLDDRGELMEDGVAVLDVNATNVRGLAALHWAVAGNQHAAVALLLERNADVCLQDRSDGTGGGRAALHYATDCLMVELLLQAGADHKVKDAAGRTAVQHHTERKRTELSNFVRLAPSEQHFAGSIWQ